MNNFSKGYAAIEEVRKRLDQRYGGVEGDAYEILVYQIAPKTYDKVILLVRIELEQPVGYLQVAFVDLNKDMGSVTIVGDHGFPEDYAEFAINLSKAIFSAAVGRICDGWN